MFPIIPLFPPMITAEQIGVPLWETALTDIVGLRLRLIVPGHGDLGGPEWRTRRWSTSSACAA